MTGILGLPSPFRDHVFGTSTSPAPTAVVPPTPKPTAMVPTRNGSRFVGSEPTVYPIVTGQVRARDTPPEAVWHRGGGGFVGTGPTAAEPSTHYRGVALESYETITPDVRPQLPGPALESAGGTG